MDSLAILIPVALLLTLIIMGAFLWAVRSNQFEDLERHSKDFLFEEEVEQNTEQNQDAGPHDK